MDIRNCQLDVSNLLTPFFVAKTTSFSKLTRGNPDNLGEFTFSSAFKIPESEEFYKGELVVLVNDQK